MSSTCDRVAERVALGEPLADVAEHAATCERCKRLVALPVELGATHRQVDPGLGFSARMTAGAQHRIGVRRRQRIAAGLAAAVAVTTLGVFALTREPKHEQLAVDPTPPTQLPAVQKDPWDSEDVIDEQTDEDVLKLVQLADVERTSKLSTNWKRIGKPLAPYRALLQGVSHE